MVLEGALAGLTHMQGVHFVDETFKIVMIMGRKAFATNFLIL